MGDDRLSQRCKEARDRKAMTKGPVTAVPGLASLLVHGGLAALLLSLAAPAQRPRSVPLRFEVRPAGSRPQRSAEADVVPAQPTPTPRPVRALPRRGRALAPTLAPAPVLAGELPVPPRAAAPMEPAAPAAPAASAPTQATPQPRTTSLPGGQGADLAGYLGRITQAVAARRSYPPMALELRLEGDVLVLATIKRDGTLARAPGLLRSCGHELLDLEALRMVSAAAPLPPLPPDYAGASAELRIPVRFRLED
ncbi:MAG: TonB family protein [Polyangia bacterium]